MRECAERNIGRAVLYVEEVGGRRGGAFGHRGLLGWSGLAC